MTDTAPKCTCFWTDPKTWFYYGSAVEPGSQMQWNPECPAHPPYVPGDPLPERDPSEVNFRGTIGERNRA